MNLLFEGLIISFIVILAYLGLMMYVIYTSDSESPK